MPRIRVRGDPLRYASSDFRRVAGDLRAVAGRLGGAIGSLDWQVRGRGGVEGQVRSARGRANELAERAEWLARFLSTTVQLLEEADRRGAGGLSAVPRLALPLPPLAPPVIRTVVGAIAVGVVRIIVGGLLPWVSWPPKIVLRALPYPASVRPPSWLGRQVERHALRSPVHLSVSRPAAQPNGRGPGASGAVVPPAARGGATSSPRPAAQPGAAGVGAAAGATIGAAPSRPATPGTGQAGPAAPTAPAPPSVSAPGVRIGPATVPFQSQWDRKTSTGRNNCGPASLTMALATYGKSVAYSEVVSRIRGANNPTGGTSFRSPEAIALLGENGLKQENVPNLDTLRTHLGQGHPVIALVDNSQFVRAEGGRSVPYPKTPGFTGTPHIVTVTGFDVNEAGEVANVYVNDPLAVRTTERGQTVEDPAGGTNYRVPVDRFLNAVGKHNWAASAVVPQ